MAMKNATSLLSTEVQATLHQARRLEDVADSLARLGASLVRVPVVLMQGVTLLLVLPFAGARALTGVLDRSAERLDKTVDSRLSKASRPRPVVLPKATAVGAPSVTLRPSHSA